MCATLMASIACSVPCFDLSKLNAIRLSLSGKMKVMQGPHLLPSFWRPTRSLRWILFHSSPSAHYVWVRECGGG